MSRDASLDFHFVRPMTSHEILEAFEVTGARPAGRDGRVAYQVDYDWTDAPLDQLETVLSHLVARSEAGDAVGIEVGWPDAVGGNVLFGDRRVVTFILPADCRKLCESLPFADMGWYLKTLIPALAPLGLDCVQSTDGYLEY